MHRKFVVLFHGYEFLLKKYILHSTRTTLKLRDIHLGRNIFKSIRIDDKLGIPIKPKKPTNIFGLFIRENLRSVSEAHPTLKVTELFSIMARMWNTIDATAKEKFIIKYKIMLAKYLNEFAEYNRTLSENDKRIIKEMKDKKKKNEIKKEMTRLKRKKAQELNRPKEPNKTFFRYIGRHTDRQPHEKHQNYLKRKASEWRTLSEAEKQIYKPPEEDVKNFM